MYPLGKCYTWTYCLFLLNSHLNLFFHLSFDMSLSLVIVLPLKAKAGHQFSGFAAYIFYSYCLFTPSFSYTQWCSATSLLPLVIHCNTRSITRGMSCTYCSSGDLGRRLVTFHILTLHLQLPQPLPEMGYYS